MKKTERNGIQRVCPICGARYTGEPTISPKDQSTPLCPECATRQALASIGVRSREGQDRIMRQIYG